MHIPNKMNIIVHDVFKDVSYSLSYPPTATEHKGQGGFACATLIIPKFSDMVYIPEIKQSIFCTSDILAIIVDIAIQI